MKTPVETVEPRASSAGLERIAVIVAALDEEECLARTLDSVLRATDVELVVVDGGSQDRTVDIARVHGARIVHAVRGRASQMNAGAAATSAPILVFLHADTELPAGWDASVRAILGRPRVSAGAFRLSFGRAPFLLRCIAHGANLRARWLELPYGDQALFVRAEAFAAAGGFPDVPIMEDVVLVRRLAARGRVALADRSVITSARRWNERGTVRTSALNSVCLAAHVCGVSPHRIARWRGARSVPPPVPAAVAHCAAAVFVSPRRGPDLG